MVEAVPANAEQNNTGVRHFPTAIYRRFSDDRVMAISGGVAFFALLAIFPAIAALVSIYGIFADAATIHNDVAAMGSVLPGGAVQIVSEQIHHVASSSNRALGLAALGGILVSIWSANSGVKAMFDALNIVLREQEKRSFIRLNLISLAFTLGELAVALFAIVVVLAVPRIPQDAWLGRLAAGSQYRTLAAHLDLRRAGRRVAVPLRPQPQ